uniref:Ionotropic glutamate receptor L-glutamate and glycine-binding domain-containing protein n=1 Tax=Anopheles melas TaxID=34690 RepID=A0A182UK64_9DIPT
MWWRRRVQLLIAALGFHCCCWARPPLPTQPLVNLADIVGVVLHTHFRTPFATTLVTVRSATQRGAWLQQDLLERLLVRHGQGQLVVQLEGVPSPAQLLHRHPPWSRTLLLAESYDALRTVFGQLTPDRFDFTGRYLIALSEAPASLATVDRIFHELWLRQIVNVVVALRPLDDDHSSAAAAAAGPVQLWTYFPFSPGLCRIPKPHLLFTWPNDTLLYGVDFYPRKSDQFHGCPLRVGSFETRPFTILAGGDGATPPAVGGFEGDLLHSLSARLNFREDVRVPPRDQQWGEAAFENSTGLMRMLYTEEVDFGLSCLGVSVERSAMLKAGKVHFTTDLVVVVPPGKPYTAFEKLFQPFQPPVWLAVGFCTGVGFGVLATLRLLPLDGGRRATVRRYVAGDARLQAPALNLVRVLLSSPLPFTPTGTFPRTLLAQWMLVSLLLSLLYQGSLFQYLQRASTHPPMRTLAEIDRAGALYHIASSARRFFLPYPQRLPRLRYFPPVPDSIAAWLRWMGSHPGEPHVAMCTRDHVAYHNAQHGRTDGRQLLIARESMALYAITILYPKRSMLTASFDQHIERIDSSGLLKYWSARYGDYHFGESRASSSSSTTDQRATATAGPRPVSVEQLAGALQLLLGMLLAATLLFLAELGWARHTRRWRHNC